MFSALRRGVQGRGWYSTKGLVYRSFSFFETRSARKHAVVKE